eukprot:10092854-Alexandrium_andersonii.AAC.1
MAALAYMLQELERNLNDVRNMLRCGPAGEGHIATRPLQTNDAHYTHMQLSEATVQANPALTANLLRPASTCHQPGESTRAQSPNGAPEGWCDAMVVEARLCAGPGGAQHA